MKDLNNNLLSHEEKNIDLDSTVALIKEQIIAQGDKPHVTCNELLKLFKELSKSEFGTFLICNKGLNGFWTDLVVTYSKGKKLNLQGLDKVILEKFPVILATQERYKIFKQLLQENLKNDISIMSIPCGLMRDLLELNYSKIKNFKLVGVDLDSDSLEEAKALAKSYNILENCNFLKINAWDLNFKNEFDVITSNGLNIYEPSSEKLIQLFQNFYTALKKDGVLITSFLTYPPDKTNNCEWDFSKINQDDLLFQRKIFMDILQVKWQCFTSANEITEQLKSVGFNEIKTIYDKAKIFPTVVARK